MLEFWEVRFDERMHSITKASESVIDECITQRNKPQRTEKPTT